MKIYEILNEDGRIVKGVNTTDDVGVDEIKVQTAKFGNTVDRDGHPPTLSKKVKGKRTVVEAGPLYAAAVLIMRIATLAEKIFKGEKFLRVSTPLQREAKFLQRMKDKVLNGKDVTLTRAQSKEIGENTNIVRTRQNKIDKLTAESNKGENISFKELSKAKAEKAAAIRKIEEILKETAQ